MTNTELEQLWNDFLQAWPLERIIAMTLEEYTNADRNEAFIYWLEKRLDPLGGIWGGSAFKFGIYCRDNLEAKPEGSGRKWGEKYAWATKYGKTEAEAFATVRNRLVETIEAVQAGNLARIDQIDMSPVVKWKVAFLFQDQANPQIFAIYKKEALFYHYQAIDPTARKDQTPYSVMYAALLERHKSMGSVLDIARQLWADYEANRPRKAQAWAVPLDTAVSPEDIDALCVKTRIEPEDVGQFLDNILSKGNLAEGDLLALLTGSDVRAVGTLTSVEDGEFAWDQTPLQSFPSGLLVAPQFEVKKLTAAEQSQIWSNVHKVASSQVSPRYWKISPGRNAVAWPIWRKEGIAAIGWPDLGDITKMSRAEFETRTAACEQSSKYKKQGMALVWTFRGVQPGDKVIASDGQYYVVGIGTVTQGYRYSPGWHMVEGEDYPHQLVVDWEDCQRRSIPQRTDWIKAIQELTKADYDSYCSAQIVAEEPVPSTLAEPTVKHAPCKPQNIILYGPPGTGKTYSTARRALKLMVPDKNFDDLSDDTVMRMFREKQSQGLVEFVTFHQSYGYEEFIEGLRPVLKDAEGGGEVRYELHDGVFKRIALRAAVAGLISKDEAPVFEQLWGQLLNNVDQEENRVVESISGKRYVMRTTERGRLRIYPCEVDAEGVVTEVGESYLCASKDFTRLIWDHRYELGPDPAQINSTKTTPLFAREYGNSGGHHYTAIWVAYKEILALSRSAAARKADIGEAIVRVQQTLDRPSAGSASFEFSVKTPQYVLIVDEINRGNISKIFGELITLLEEDKRIGTTGELKLPLSYSPTHRFAVPPNLHVIGTMNTADRSIALMDVALRRRFTFEELMPNSSIIRQVLEKEVTDKKVIDLVVDVFESVNQRIRFVYDRDHQLGHSYFLSVRNLDDLRKVFIDRVIPLLQEYFYGAWDKICMVLGCPYSEDGRPERRGTVIKDGLYAAPIIKPNLFDEEATLGFNHDDYENRLDFKVDQTFALSNSPDEVFLPYFLGVLTEGKYAEHQIAWHGGISIVTDPSPVTNVTE